MVAGEMLSNRGTLLLIAIAALCAGASAPVSALAGAVFTANQEAILEGEPTGPNVFAAGGIGKECAQVGLGATLDGNSRRLELVPSYGECEAKELNGIPAKLVFWECAYVLHGAERTGEGEVWRAGVDIACPNGHSMEWNVYESDSAYSTGNPSCVTSAPPQRKVGTAVLSNTQGAREDVEIRWNLSGIRYTVRGSSLLCGALPGMVKRSGSYRGTTTIAAKDIVSPFPTAGHYIDFSIVG